MGYSYDVISNPHLFLPETVVQEGTLCPEGPAYRALLVVDQEMLPIASAEKLLELEVATTLINRLRIAHPLFDGKGGMPAPPSPSASENGEAPIMGNLEDADYELPPAPMDMPVPGTAEYHYGIRRAEITPYRNA